MMYVVGQALDLEFALRGVAKATEKADYAVAMAKRAKIAEKRIENAAYYDKHLGNIPKITIPPRPVDYRIVYHLYIVFAEHRNELLEYCLDKGIEAKIHYLVPIYRQPALSLIHI